MATMSDVYTSNEAGKILGILGATVRQYCLSGRIRATKVGRDWIIEKQEIQRFQAIPRKVGNPQFRKNKK